MSDKLKVDLDEVVSGYFYVEIDNLENKSLINRVWSKIKEVF